MEIESTLSSFKKITIETTLTNHLLRGVKPSTDDVVKVIRSKVGGGKKEIPSIETTPNELGGTATQDSHNLGCTRDDRSPMRDGRVEKMLVMARASVGGLSGTDMKKKSEQAISTRARSNVGERSSGGSGSSSGSGAGVDQA